MDCFNVDKKKCFDFGIQLKTLYNRKESTVISKWINNEKDISDTEAYTAGFFGDYVSF